MTEEYEALVYDLDGTLVRLAVDWEAARREAAAALRARGIDTDGFDLWDVLEVADERGHRRVVDETIAAHEREGARTSDLLPPGERIPDGIPVGVCSLNAESACRIALEVHGLDADVDAVVGRDTTGSYKPDPESLLETVDRLGATPDETLFVGDSERDAEAARRAGVSFEFVADREAARS